MIHKYKNSPGLWPLGGFLCLIRYKKVHINFITLSPTCLCKFYPQRHSANDHLILHILCFIFTIPGNAVVEKSLFLTNMYKDNMRNISFPFLLLGSFYTIAIFCFMYLLYRKHVNASLFVLWKKIISRKLLA